MREAERKTTETRVSGSTTTASTVIDRPGISGSFETMEKRSAVTDGPADNQHTTESVYSRGVSGGFQETVRTVKTASKQNDTTKETTATYEPGLNGQLQLDSQSDSTTTKQPDGTQMTQTDVFHENGRRKCSGQQRGYARQGTADSSSAGRIPMARWPKR